MIRLARADQPRILLVDLNNFARFPTLSVGLIAAVLRAAAFDVELLSPLAVGVQGVARPDRARPLGYWDERLRWWSATTRSPAIRAARAALGRWRAPERSSRGAALLGAFRDALARRPDAVLVSAYLMYHDAVGRMADLSRAAGVPIVVGGPAFHDAATRTAWLARPGLTGVFAGEAEGSIVALLNVLLRGEAVELAGFSRPGAPDAGLAPPLADLDAWPYPDYADFPWDRYPRRIVPVLTARGCGWGACRFCSDVRTVAGRTFRTRSLANVLGELRHHADVHRASIFCFSDLKLNSDLGVWRGLHEEMPRVVPGARWTCAVHVGPRTDEGLSPGDLRAARRAGLVRMTTGLETASDRLLASMRKGTSVERLRDVLAHAHEAGISTRVTAFTGFPGETPEDLEATAKFLERARRHVERVHLSRLLVQSGTPLERDLERGTLREVGFEPLAKQPLLAASAHRNRWSERPPYGRAVARLLRAAHAINRRPLRAAAREVEGAM